MIVLIWYEPSEHGGLGLVPSEPSYCKQFDPQSAQRQEVRQTYLFWVVGCTIFVPFFFFFLKKCARKPRVRLPGRMPNPVCCLISVSRCSVPNINSHLWYLKPLVQNSKQSHSLGLISPQFMNTYMLHLMEVSHAFKNYSETRQVFCLQSE